MNVANSLEVGSLSDQNPVPSCKVIHFITWAHATSDKTQSWWRLLGVS